MKYTLVYSLVAAFLGSAAGYLQVKLANAGEAPRPHYLSRFDQQFNAADQDGDGALTRQEAQVAGMQRIVDNFDRIDANKDGKVTREEIRARILTRLSS